MNKIQFTLQSKKQITHDVFELIYSYENLSDTIKAGQYVMFQLLPGLNRAYSVASFTKNSFTLIIKRIGDGRGSPMICDAEIGASFSGLFPLGHFVLENTHKSKCFIGTGTGFAPLYCQMLECRNIIDFHSSIAFIFGVRSFEDIFYENEITEIGITFRNFQYKKYFSREEDFSSRTYSQKGYVTDWITEENIISYQEFYLCGSPAMVKSAREKLENLGIAKEMIFWEQF